MSKRTSHIPEGKKSKSNTHRKNIGMDQESTEELIESGLGKDITAENLEEQEYTAEDKSDRPDAEDELTGKLEKAEKESREYYDKYLRLSAEFDNYRKRTLKEKSDLLRFANEEILKGMLPVIDDFERGIDSIEKSSDIEALKTGVRLIYNKFCEFIKQNGLKEIEARDQAFNLDLHEAVTAVPAPSENQKGKILDVIEKGYTLNDKVIRYAKVVLGE
jgi:molecular chaperone GrpE